MRLLTRAAVVVCLVCSTLGVTASRGAAGVPSSTSAPSRVGFRVDDYAALLQRHVNPAGHVRYAQLKRDPELPRILTRFAKTSPENQPRVFPTRDDKLAYWINAYNLFVLAGVAKTWPARSVRDDGTDAFFTKTQFVAGGKSYTLNQIEGDIIRKGFHEPRIHFTINCGAASCPALKPKPFSGADLDARLDQAARLFINDPRNVRVDAKAGVLWLSEIFDWYADDFLAAPHAAAAGAPPSVQRYIAHYFTGDGAAALRGAPLTIKYLDYDWSLNADVLPVR